MMKTYKTISGPHVVAAINAGAVGVLPTDTVYGLVCSVNNRDAVARLYALKHRHHKPGTIIAASPDQLINLGIRKQNLSKVLRYWPGPVSVVVPDTRSLGYLDLGMQSLAVRVTDDKTLLALLNQTGPLLTTSANLPGQPTATSLDEAYRYFKESVDFYVDGGDYRGRPASTLIRLVDGKIEVLRPGAVRVEP